MSWFLNMAHEAKIQAEDQVEFTLRKAKLFDRLKDAINQIFALARFPFVSSVPRHHQSCSYSWEESHEAMPPTVRPTATQVKSPVLTGHSLRHTATTMALEGGAPITAVKDMLRHSSHKQANVYVHTHDRMKRGVERFFTQY